MESMELRKAGLKVGYVPQKLAIDWTLPLTVRRLMTLTGPLSPEQASVVSAAIGVTPLSE